jgi:hypothetical protein
VLRHAGTYTEGAYSYTGDWTDDQMHGQGTFTFASGSSYTGAFVHGKYQGQGVYAWPDGRMYQVSPPALLSGSVGFLNAHDACTYQ